MSGHSTLRKQSAPFTQVPNTLLTDSRISLKAKGLYALMFSKPDGWTFYEAALVKESKDGPDAVSTGLAELVNAGWLRRERVKNAQGQYSAYDYEMLVSQSGLSTPEKPPREIQGGKSTPNNTDGEDKEKETPQPPTGGVRWEEDSSFVQVIEAYAAISPDRTDRDKAWEVWKGKGFGKDAAQILAAMPKFAESRKWQDGYAPNLSRWLREEAWRHVAKGLTPPDVLAERERINREGIAAHARIETDVRYGRNPLPADIAMRDRWLELQGRPSQSRVDVAPAE